MIYLVYCTVGRYGEDFVEKRREKLQMWTNRIARHPVISRSDVIYHFLHCHDSDERVCELMCLLFYIRVHVLM